ncbi:MFS transporter [Oceanospirillum sediminis]|uniref:MFS transporter n=1 Tax=Oceanospirillum sediminis TaxID=2760088 RepID=A0A839ITG8_9GAMM|nr:MFS transporter [Oceanospirillum sediminis]MBB1488605.1 MFS transporter [Oceanospirillum sediminis]
MSVRRINPWWVVAAAAVILAYNMGIRLTTSLLIPDINQDLGISQTDLAFGFAMQNLLWGAVSPVAGLMAERFGTVRVLLAGLILYGSGLIVSALSDSNTGFFIGNAVLLGVGVGASTFPIVLAAVGKRFPEQKRTLALGVASAGGSLGQFGYAWALGQINPVAGWSDTLMIFAGTTLVAAGLVWLMADEQKQQDENTAAGKRALFDWQAIGDAFKVRDYQLLNIGFFVCGFHIAFISVHMAGFVSFCGLPSTVASNSIALIGLVNVAGSILSGWAGDRWHKPWLLTLVYGTRTVLIIMLMVLPKTYETFYLFSAVMGMLWLSTVPLTSGCVAHLFGTKNLASLFGIVMFSHQIGAFFGSWWGGLLFDWYGDYSMALSVSAGLGLLAAMVHLPMTPARFRAMKASA